MDAVADGDVIEMGPGRYDDFVSYEFGVWRIVLIEDNNLTFIGAGEQFILWRPGHLPAVPEIDSGESR